MWGNWVSYSVVLASGITNNCSDDTVLGNERNILVFYLYSWISRIIKIVSKVPLVIINDRHHKLVNIKTPEQHDVHNCKWAREWHKISLSVSFIFHPCKLTAQNIIVKGGKRGFNIYSCPCKFRRQTVVSKILEMHPHFFSHFLSQHS